MCLCRQCEHQITLCTQKIFVKPLDHHDNHDHADYEHRGAEQDTCYNRELLDKELGESIHAQPKIEGKQAGGEDHHCIQGEQHPSHRFHFIFKQFS